MKTLLPAILLFLTVNFVYGQSTQKNRTIILTDIEADPDDTQSLVRLLPQSMTSNMIMTASDDSGIDNLRKIKLRYEIKARFEII